MVKQNATKGENPFDFLVVGFHCGEAATDCIPFSFGGVSFWYMVFCVGCQF